jgi:hypothetical protein
MSNDFIVVSNKQNILKFNQEEVNQSNLLKYIPRDGISFFSLDHVSEEIKKDIVPLINYGLKLGSIAAHVQVSSKILSKYLKENGFHWIIEYRAYVNESTYNSYKASKIKTKPKSLKKTHFKKISLKLSSLANNIVEIQRYSFDQTTEEAVNQIIESTCSTEVKKFADKFTVIVKSKEINID